MDRVKSTIVTNLWPPSCTLRSHADLRHSEGRPSLFGGAMNYRTFVDLAGGRGEVWLVLPAAAGRRADERRRMSDRRGSDPSGAGKRRLAPPRATAPPRPLRG